MKTNPVAAGIAFGVFWAMGVAGMTAIALLCGAKPGVEYTGYGAEFVRLLASIYPGYGISLGGAAAGVVWALLDGFVSAAVLVWLYNFFCCLLEGEKTPRECAAPNTKLHVRI